MGDQRRSAVHGDYDGDGCRNSEDEDADGDGVADERWTTHRFRC